MIPFLDVGATYRELKGDIDAAVGRVLASGWYVLGPEVETFEKAFAVWTGAGHCVGVANGLDAIALALRSVGVTTGDEVIVPANTYIATWLAVTQIGAVPVPVDPDPNTRCLDPRRAEAAITDRTKAVLPVHLYGHPADMSAFREIGRRRGVRIVEDAAQAHGAALDRVRIGTHGDAVAWSFYPGKNLGAFGDAGAVTTDRPEIASAIRRLRNYGSAEKYVNETCGVNSRLDPMQAAILNAKLDRLDEWNRRRAEVADLYTHRLAGLPLGLPSTAPDAEHAWHLYVVTHPHRDALRRALHERGIETLIHYPIPPYRQAAYADLNLDAMRWPITERLAKEGLSLPIGPHLSKDSAERITDAIRHALVSLP